MISFKENQLININEVHKFNTTNYNIKLLAMSNEIAKKNEEIKLLELTLEKQKIESEELYNEKGILLKNKQMNELLINKFKVI